MILIAFENNVLPLPKQYPSKNLDDCKEDEMDSTQIIPEETDELFPSSVEEERMKKKKCFKRCSKKNIILLMSLVNRFLKQKET